MRLKFFSNYGAWYVRKLRLVGSRAVYATLALVGIFLYTLWKSPDPAIIPGPNYVHSSVLVQTSSLEHPAFSYAAGINQDVNLGGLSVTVGNLFVLPNETGLSLIVHYPKPSAPKAPPIGAAWFQSPAQMHVIDNFNDHVTGTYEEQQSLADGGQNDVAYFVLFSNLSPAVHHVVIQFTNGQTSASFPFDVKLSELAGYDIPPFMLKNHI